MNKGYKYSFDKNTNIRLIILLFIFIFLIVVFNSDNKNKMEVDKIEVSIDQPSIINPANLSLNEYIYLKLKDVTKETAEISIWNDSKNLIVESDKNEGPFDEIIVNFPLKNNFNCDYSKTISYEVIKSVYSDQLINTKVGRVKISIPNNLNISLGSKEALPIAKNNGFEMDKSVFFKVMKDWEYFSFIDDLDFPERTYGIFLKNCLEN